MNQLQMLKIALIGYVNSMKAVWSDKLYPLSIISKRNGKLKDYHIYGNTVQDGEPAPENPIPMQSVGEPTCNLFRHITGYVQQGKVIEQLPNGAIVEGNPSSGSYSWSNGWYSPGYMESDAICPTFYTGDVVTVSADITLLELKNGASYVPVVGLMVVDESGTTGRVSTTVAVNETKRVSRTFTIEEKLNGKRVYPMVTLNSNVVKIENVQIAYGNAIDYEPYQKYKIPVTVSNGAGNLFDKDNARFLNAYIRVADSTYRPASDSASVLIECEPNETYTISHSIDNLGIFRACYINDEPSGSFVIPVYSVAQASTNQKTLTVTTGEGCKYIVVQITLGVFNEVANTLTVTKEIDEGSAESQTFNIYLDEPLRKVPDAEDYIDFEKGVVVRSLKECALTGNESWYREFFRVYCFVEKSSSDGNKMLCISNKFVPYSWEKLYQNSFLATKNVGIAQQSGGIICITPSQDIPSVEDWKAQLKAWNDEENPLTVIYYVKPTEEKIELPKLPQYKGTTIYEVDTTVNPSGMEVCYYE